MRRVIGTPSKRQGDKARRNGTSPHLAGLGQECREDELEADQEVAPGPRALADRHPLPAETPLVPGADDLRARQAQHAPVQGRDLGAAGKFVAPTQFAPPLKNRLFGPRFGLLFLGGEINRLYIDFGVEGLIQALDEVKLLLCGRLEAGVS